MKNYSIILTLCLVASWSMAQQQVCGCYTETNVSESYLYQTGRVSAAYGKVNVPLTHGSEIKPVAGSTIVFKFNETPNVRPSCKKMVYIDIYDEKSRQNIHSLQIADRLEASYNFPLSDRTYTVTLAISAVSTAPEDVGLHTAANRDCTKRISVFVIPTPTKKPFNKNPLTPAKN